MNTYVGGVIEGTMLSDGAKDGLMVSSGIDGSDTVSASRETLCNGRGENTT